MRKRVNEDGHIENEGWFIETDSFGRIISNERIFIPIGYDKEISFCRNFTQKMNNTTLFA